MSAPVISEHGVLTAAGMLGILPATYRRHIAAGERWCGGLCQDWRPVGLFTPLAARGLGVRRYCQPCERARDRARHQAARRQAAS